MSTYRMSWVKHASSRKVTYSDIETVRQLEKRGITDSYIDPGARLIRNVDLTGTNQEIMAKRSKVAEALRATYSGRGYLWEQID